jgi:hypothetical protein
MLLNEGGDVLHLFRYRGRLRRWIAAPSGFALALHLILSSAIVGHFAASKAEAADDIFVICHGSVDNSSADPDAPPPQPGYQSHCVLCALVNDACALIPTVTAIAAFDVGAFSQHAIARNSQVIQFVPLASEYPRGPPTHAICSSLPFGNSFPCDEMACDVSPSKTIGAAGQFCPGAVVPIPHGSPADAA